MAKQCNSKIQYLVEVPLFPLNYSQFCFRKKKRTRMCPILPSTLILNSKSEQSMKTAWKKEQNVVIHSSYSNNCYVCDLLFISYSTLILYVKRRNVKAVEKICKICKRRDVESFVYFLFCDFLRKLCYAHKEAPRTWNHSSASALIFFFSPLALSFLTEKFAAV